MQIVANRTDTRELTSLADLVENIPISTVHNYFTFKGRQAEVLIGWAGWCMHALFLSGVEVEVLRANKYLLTFVLLQTEILILPAKWFIFACIAGNVEELFCLAWRNFLALYIVYVEVTVSSAFGDVQAFFFLFIEVLLLAA